MNQLRFIPFILLPGLLSVLHAETEVNARFDPARVAVGERADYLIEITESSSKSPPDNVRINSIRAPKVENLELRERGTSTSRHISMGTGGTRYESTVTLNFKAIPEAKGTITVPSFTFDAGGKEITVPEAELEVVEASERSGPTLDELLFLDADIPSTMYVGQTIATELRLHVAPNVNLYGIHSFNRSGDGFTASDLPEQTAQSRATVQGQSYNVLSWPLILTPVSSGNEELEFEFKVSANLPKRKDSRQSGRRGSPFGSGSFEQFFQEREFFDIGTDGITVEVLPLPEEDRPDSFTGAIGTFHMETNADSDTAEVGEPVMLSIKVHGEGNFSRIKQPALPETENWRKYSPEITFEPEDELEYRGTKRFDFLFVPQEAGKQKLPEVRFAFFDPDDEAYVELSAPPAVIEVEPAEDDADREGQADAGNETTTPGADSENADASASSDDPDTLIADPGSTRTPGTPLLEQAWFYIANILALLALLSLALVLRHKRRLREDPEYARLHATGRELRKQLAQLKSAETHGDAGAFYQHAQQAIRLAATRRCGENLRAANQRELDDALSRHNYPESIRTKVRTLFETGDTLRFSERRSPADIKDARSHFDTVIKAL